MKPKSTTRVLVVDDEAMVSELVRDQLMRLGYQVCGLACDGEEAVELTCELHPDVVIMDLQMPDPATGRGDPLAGLKAAKTIQEVCPTPVIILTAYESPELVKQASETGVGAYLVKPSMENALDRAITVALARFLDLMQLRQLNADLQARNDELDAFAHTVAHDLKHPLVTTLGYAEYMLQDFESLTRGEVRQHLQSIARQGRRMNNIIEELLLLASVRHVAELEVDVLHMGHVVGEALLRLVDLVRESSAEVVLPHNWPVAVGYGPWVEEVWVNYLSNAIHYGGQPPRVEIGAAREGDGVIRFWVSDNGPGLAEEDQEQLFAPFTRLSQARLKGHGLGLSIVRRIVQRLGGTVDVESRLGEGSTFSFTLPAGS